MGNVRLFLSDVDGVMTDGGLYLSEKGDEQKKFFIPDGLAIAMLPRLGIQTGIITSENLTLIERRAQKLKLDFLRMGARDKLTIAQEICQQVGCDLSEVAFIGDDVNDFTLLSKVGFPACPADAQAIIRRIPNIKVMSAPGGRGAIREFINSIVGEEALLKAWTAP